MLGLLIDCGYFITSNRESGKGRFDILLEPENEVHPLMMLEFKITSNEASLDKQAQKALLQIQVKEYLDDPKFDKYKMKIGYGIAFCQKECRVRMMEPKESHGQ